MEGIVGDVAGADLTALITKFCSLAVNEISMVPGLPENIEWLKEELDNIRAVLRDLSDEEDPSDKMKLWRIKQIELMYDMEDAIEKFYLNRESIMNEIQRCIQSTKSLGRKYSIANKIAILKNRSMNYERQPKRTKKSTEVNLKRMNALKKSRRADLVAMDGPRNHVINLLDFHSPQPHKVVFIVGGGGLGKTTLAGHILNEVNSTAKFSCSACVFVTRKPDIKNILIRILLDFGYKGKMEELKLCDVQTVMDLLAEYVKKKRYFLVVDDIWDSSPWDVIKTALFNNISGGRIIVTTRMKDVAIKCRSFDNDHIHVIEPLNKNDAKELLLRVFPDRTCPPVLQEPFDKILKKCGGLPLAITTVSGVLRGKVTPGQWNQVYDSLKLANPHSDVDVMRRIISLSYFALPYHLRACLLYFSIFPEDMVIKRKRLISRWSAEGLIHAQDGEDVMEKGKCYFDDLIKSSLIQPEKIKYDGEARACRLHDTIHDYITTKAVEENFVALQFGDNKYVRCPHGSKFRRLSVHNSNEEVSIRLGYNLSHVRSLTVFGNFDDTLGCPVGDSALRVLDLEDATIRYHHGISVIVHLQLKYLSLMKDTIIGAPDIDRLRYLETLHFGVDWVELPSSISNLRRLVRLFVSEFVEFPDSIAGMVALEELKGVNIGAQSIEFLKNLCQLEKLKVLGVCWSCENEVDEKERLLVTSIHNLLGKQLRSISVEANYENCVKPHIDQWFDHDDNYGKLLKFCTTGGFVSRVPNWLSFHLVRNMQKLRLCISNMQQEDFNILGSLQCLLYLFLDHKVDDNQDDMLIIPNVDDNQDNMLIIPSMGGFESLRYFCVVTSSMRYLFQPGSMPRLQNLELVFYPSHSHQFDFGIDNLSHVPMIDVTILYKFDNPEEEELALQAETAINTAANNLGNGSTIKINREDREWWFY